MTFHGPVDSLKKEIRTLDVVLTSRAIKTGVTSYKLFDCDDLRTKKATKQQAESSTSSLHLQPTSPDSIEQQTPPQQEQQLQTPFTTSEPQQETISFPSTHRLQENSSQKTPLQKSQDRGKVFMNIMINTQISLSLFYFIRKLS